MIPWLILNHVNDDVIKRIYEIKEKEWKMESHTFGLRKEGRKLPLFDHTVNAPKREEKFKEKGVNGKKMKEKMKEDEKRNEKKKEKQKEGIKQRKKPRENVGEKE